ncbi:MAG: response regulator [Ferruginibacter sp.]|nr:response regulator [Ferruginibacter sp.]
MNEDETVNASVLPTRLPFHILLADDDSDDRHFFEKILNEIPIPTRFTALTDGEKLMTYLFKNSAKLPDALFLDFNMPRKNGAECLSAITLSDKLKHLPVIIYSTSLHRDLANQLYNNGAYYYIRKTDLADLRNVLFYILTLLEQGKFMRPGREQFILSLNPV